MLSTLLLPLRFAARRGGARWQRLDLGFCPICERETVFATLGPWLRDEWLCCRCDSIPRWRALAHVLETRFPDWRDLVIHESSPAGAASDKLARECRRYLPTHYFPGVAPGTVHRGFRCEDLERQTFPDASFDLVVTQDVFEHLFDPAAAFREIARTLRPGGAHVFTVPMYPRAETVVRASRAPDGSVVHHLPPDFHGSPFGDGALVIREWGRDVPAFIEAASGSETSVIAVRNRSIGLDGEFIEVLVSSG